MKEFDNNINDKNQEPLPVLKFDFDLEKSRDDFGFSMNNRKQSRRKKSILEDTIMQYLFFSLTIMWAEIIYHIFTFHTIDGTIIFPILFALGIAGLFTLLTGFFPSKANQIFTWIFAGLICVLYATELVYFSIFKQPLFLYAAGAGAGQVTAYWKEALDAVKENFFGIILIFVPLLVLYFMLKRHISSNRRPLLFQITILFATIIVYIVPVFVLSLGGKSDGTVYASYYNFTDVNKAMKDLGVITTLRLDAEKVLLPGTTDDEINHDLVINNTPDPDNELPSEATSVPAVQASPTAQPSSPNVIDIDFDGLIASEKDNTINNMHEYFKSLTPTNKNEYTGMFKGYNLIHITAEAFSPYCVDENITPTLYKLTHEGFVFNNFYTPLWQTSTSDGEFVNCTGLLPDQQFSFRRSGNISLPFTMAHQFNRLGVESKAYHDNSLSYYDRYKTHPNMGYLFKAALLGKLSAKKYGNQIFSMENPKAWPQSDLEMMQSTVPEYATDEQFHAYYMTVSGHMNYNFEGNAMSSKNKEAVADLPYSDEAKAYIACNIELDKAMANLIEQLSAAGVLDKTVICMSADHYPYGLDKSAIDELAGHKVDENFEIYKNNLILWNSAMTTPIQIDKPVSSLDIIPTLSNLFGFTFDSRLLLGTDALSDSDPLVILANRSFITDKVMYNSSTKDVSNLTDEEVSDEYIKNISQIIKNKFIISAGILDYDYYSTLEDQLDLE